MMRFYSSVPVYLIFFILAPLACAPFRPEPTKPVIKDIPARYSEITNEVEPGIKWWLTFEDADLNALIEEAFSENLNLQEIRARLEQARASAIIAGADLYPDLTGTGGVAYSRRRRKNGVTETSTPKEYSAGLSSSYEIDLWGRIRAEKKSALIEVEARREDLNAAAITLAAEIVDRWLRIASQNMQIELLNQQLEVNRTFLELIELRFRQAMVSALDVYQQQQIIDRLRAEIPLVEAEKSRLINELTVLLGKTPGSISDITRNELPGLSPAPPAGIPADLLKYRPDIAAAQRRLQAAGWDVAAARANRLPSISLTARSALSSEHLDLILDNWVLNLASNLTGPILDGGRRAAVVHRNIAIVNENFAFYRKTVLEAIREVEDSLVTEYRQKEHIEKLETVIETARKALQQAVLRYRNGLTDYLPVLTQISAVQDLERNLIVQRQNLTTNRVKLFRAIGGAWPKAAIYPDDQSGL